MEYLAPLENFVSFVKSCEKLVRISPDYKKYIAFVKGLGLNTCQVLGNIQELDPSDNLIEMHHGPMLTLFDYCAIVINYRLYTNQKINSFIIANIVINEHFSGNVQTIMVSETVHEAIHVPGGPFISLDQGYGDVYGFLKGDEIIEFTAQTILKCTHELFLENSFIGHIGGDDFIAIVPSTEVDAICQSIIATFDKDVEKFFTDEDLEKGYIEVENRKGIIEQFPLTSISIGVVIVEKGRFSNILEIGDVGAQVKHMAKSIMGSSYAVDRRQSH